MRCCMRYLLAVGFLLQVTVAGASDVYVVQGSAQGQTIIASGFCEGVLWSSDLTLYNRGLQASSVKVIDISNGDRHAQLGDTLLVPPHKAIGKPSTWTGATRDPLWVLHLDVPPEL